MVEPRNPFLQAAVVVGLAVLEPARRYLLRQTRNIRLQLAQAEQASNLPDQTVVIVRFPPSHLLAAEAVALQMLRLLLLNLAAPVVALEITLALVLRVMATHQALRQVRETMAAHLDQIVEIMAQEAVAVHLPLVQMEPEQMVATAVLEPPHLFPAAVLLTRVAAVVQHITEEPLGQVAPVVVARVILALVLELLAPLILAAVVVGLAARVQQQAVLAAPV